MPRSPNGGASSPNGVEETPPSSSVTPNATSAKSPPNNSRCSGGRSAKSMLTTPKGAGAGAKLKTGRWTKREDDLLRTAIIESKGDDQDWENISDEWFANSRSAEQCQNRWEKVLKVGLRKGQWTEEEDEIVRREVAAYTGPLELKWTTIAQRLDGRLGKQVRERWQNHLDPALSKEPWGEDEDQLLISLQAVMGNRWSEIARAFAGRSENSVKNRWNSKQRRNLAAERKLKTGSELGVLIRRRPVVNDISKKNSNSNSKNENNSDDAQCSVKGESSDGSRRNCSRSSVGNIRRSSIGEQVKGFRMMTDDEEAVALASCCELKIDFARALEAAKNGPRPEERSAKQHGHVRRSANALFSQPLTGIKSNQARRLQPELIPLSQHRQQLSPRYNTPPGTVSCALLRAANLQDNDVKDAGITLLSLLNKENN